MKLGKVGRPPIINNKLNKFSSKGIIRGSELVRAGISRMSIHRAVKDGILEKLGAGFYIHKDSSLMGVERQFSLICKYFGAKAIIGGITALFYYSLIEQVPGYVWVLVPYSNKKKHPLCRCVYTKASPNVGVESHPDFKIVSIERSLVEALKLSNKIGLDIVYEAITQALKDKKTNTQKHYEMAKKMKLEKIFAKHWEAIHLAEKVKR
jgi:predicted transcriptional regulator of viral defense system